MSINGNNLNQNRTVLPNWFENVFRMNQRRTIKIRGFIEIGNGFKIIKSKWIKIKLY